MSPLKSSPPPGWIVGRRVFAMALALLAMGTGRADAALLTTIFRPSLSAPNEHSIAEAHSQECACATKCRGPSCCCGPKSHAKPPPDQATNSRPSNPCVRSTPCGEPGLPTGLPSVVSLDKSATLARPSAIARPTGRLVRSAWESPMIPVVLACRIERPPDLRLSRNP